jgi:proline iminopeptidase
MIFMNGAASMVRMSGPPTPQHPPAARFSGQLAVGGGHVLAWQEFGAADGVPVLVLHGGPGSAFGPALLHCFEVQRWRIIGFDQRGCGASTPRGATRENTTAHLLQDIEALRQARGVERWCVVGGSWGATLALAHAAAQPRHVGGLVLRNMFVPEPAELRWFFHEARPLAPEAWDRLAALAPPEVRDALLPWLAAVFAGGDAALQAQLALAWLAWEHALAGAAAPQDVDLAQAVDRYRVQSHYLVHGCWLDGGALLAAARALPRLPVQFLHGASDRVCRPAAAQAVAALVSGSRFELVPGAGHDPFHPAMATALRGALQRLLEQSTVIPAQAGIQDALGARLRGNDAGRVVQ